MSCPNENRLRRKTVCFRASDEEEKRICAKQIISGKAKADFILEALLEVEIKIIVGKFESDRLAVEIKRLREMINQVHQDRNDFEIESILNEIKELLDLLVKVNGQI